jgi:hypothetical protein
MPFEITKDDQKYIFYIHILDKSYSIEISFIGLEELDFDNEKLAAIEKLFKTIGEALCPVTDGSCVACIPIYDLVPFEGKAMHEVLNMTKDEVKSMSPILSLCGILTALNVFAISQVRRSVNKHLMDFLSMFHCIRKRSTNSAVLMDVTFQITTFLFQNAASDIC